MHEHQATPYHKAIKEWGQQRCLRCSDCGKHGANTIGGVIPTPLFSAETTVKATIIDARPYQQCLMVDFYGICLRLNNNTAYSEGREATDVW